MTMRRGARDTDRPARALGLDEVVKPRSGRSSPTLASIVQQRIASDISNHHLPSGMRLEEEELARRYNVSRTPVREALRQLSALGIVEFRQRQGMIVAERSARHFTNLLEVVADLEGAAARYAAFRMSDDGRRRLVDLQEQMWTLVEDGKAARFDRANSELHRMVHEGANNDILFSGITQMRMRTLPYTRVEFITERFRMKKSHMEHHAFVQAIERRDPEAAYYAMRLHVIEAGQVQEDRAATMPA